MPPHPIPSSSAWGKRDVKGKQTRYPLYAPPPNAAAAAELLKAEKKRAIVPSKPLRSPSLQTERSPLLSASPSTASFQSQHSHYSSHSQSQFYPSTSSSSSHYDSQHSSRSRGVTTPTPIPVPQIPPRHPSPYLHGSGSADGTHTKPGQSTPREVFLIQERRSSHGATAPLSSSPLAQASFISPMPSSSYSGQDLRPSTSGSSSTSLPSNHERRASSSDSESSVAKPKLTPPRLPTEPERGEIEQKRKPFYRPRPLWLVPFAILAALVRGMTLAPRVEVYTQLACLSPPPTPSLPPITIPDQEPPTKRRRTELASEKGWTPDSAISLYASLDPMGPHLFPAPQLQRVPRALPPPSSSPSPSRSRNSTLPFTSLHTSQQDSSQADFDATRRPSQCSSSPLTQARAAKLQTLVSTTTGLLSALSTTFWGRISSRHGRTRVLAVATLGLLTTDLVFAVVASPSVPWPFSLVSGVFKHLPLPAGWTPGPEYRQYLLLVGPLVEGTLGGWTSLQSAVLAYLSDCTSAGGRAGVFARFTGVFYVGFSVGPVAGGWVVRHSRLFERISMGLGFERVLGGKEGLVGRMGERVGKSAKGQESVVTVFWVAVVCSFVNFLLVLFVFPESLEKVRAQEGLAQANSSPSSSLAIDTTTAQDSSLHKGKARSTEYNVSSATPTPIASRHPIFPIVEDVEVGGGDGFVDVDDLPSPISPSGSGFLSSSSRSALPSPTDSTPLLLSRSNAQLVSGKETGKDTGKEEDNRGVVKSLLSPLAVFLPTKHLAPTRNMLHLRYATDWSLTLLAVGLVGWMLSTGVYQIKYLYAGHVYGWGASELSEYVSWMGFVRAVVLLWIIPSSVTYLKERSLRREAERQARWDGYGLKVAGGSKDVHDEDGGEDGERKGKKKPLTRLQLGKSIRFDLRLARVSLLVDFISNVLIAVTPSPSFHSSIALLQALRGETSPLASTSASATGLVSGLAAAGRHTTITHAQSQAMFVAASSLSAFGGGLVPAVHSLALCIVQARGLEPELRAFARDVEEPHSYGSITSHYQDIPSHDEDDAPKISPPVDAATLLSAFAVLQALSQSILAPLLFGFVYSSTVSTSPKLVFVLSAGLLMLSMGVVCSVRNPVGEVRAVRRERRMREGVERVQERLVAARKASVNLSGGIVVSGSVGGKGVTVVSAGQQHHGGGGVVKATLAAAKTTVAPTPAKAIPPSLNLHAKAPVAPLPIVKRWERDMGRRGRSVVSKDLRGGAVSVSASYQDNEGTSGSFQSYRDSVGLGGSVPGPSGHHFYRQGSSAGQQQQQQGYRFVGGGQYGSLNAGQGRGYGSVSGSWKPASGGATGSA